MTAFFFDEDHPDFTALLGTGCASQAIRTIQSLRNFPLSRLFHGSLLHSHYAYELSEVSWHGPDGNDGEAPRRLSGHTLIGNSDRLMAVICDLAETMHESGSSISAETLLQILGRKNVWLFVVHRLPDEYRAQIDQSLSQLAPYLGWVKVNWTDPVHRDLFATSLFGKLLIDSDRLIVRSEFLEDSEDQEDERALARDFGALREPVLLTWDEFDDVAPPMDPIRVISDRSKISMNRILSTEQNHRRKIGWALIHDNSVIDTDSGSFSAIRPERGVDFFVSEAKMTAYLLNVNHRDGGPKARFFRDTLGIVREDWRYLADQICQGAGKAELYRLNANKYGIMHGAKVVVIGRNGRRAVVETGWKLGESGPAQFVTAYPGNEDEVIDLPSFEGRVPPLDCVGSDRWAMIHRMAHESGSRRSADKSPTPMVLEGWGTIWDGACGFGWIRLPDGRTSFAKWIIDHEIGYLSRPGVRIYSPLATQSLDKHKAYAEGYAEVLSANGIACDVQSRLD